MEREAIMMYCRDCGNAFDFDDAHTEREYQGAYPQGVYVNWYYCPYCRSDDFDEAVICECCDEYSIDLVDGFCPDCQKEAI